MHVPQVTPAEPPATIAWVSCVGEKGGAEVTMLHTFRVLDQARFTPRMIQLRPGPVEAEALALGVGTDVLAKHRMRNVFGVGLAVFRICRLVRRHRIRLLHGNGFRAHAYSGLAARLTGIPNVLTVHSPEPPGLFTRALLQIPCDHLIANCQTTADWFTGAGLSPEIIWPGVNSTHLRRRSTREDLAARYGIPADRQWVSMCARIQRHKGQHHFIRTIAAQPAGLGVHGILVGAPLFGLDGDYLVELKAEVARLGISDRITFAGFVDDADAAGFQAASAVNLHTALLEDFGLAVVESMILGVPVVAFAASGPAVIITPGTGWLAPAGNQSALDARLTEALQSPELRVRFGAAARQRALDHYTIEHHVARTEEAYARLLRMPRAKSAK